MLQRPTHLRKLNNNIERTIYEEVYVPLPDEVCRTCFLDVDVSCDVSMVDDMLMSNSNARSSDIRGIDHVPSVPLTTARIETLDREEKRSRSYMNESI